MAVEWYCQLMGSDLGPLNVEQLVDMVRQHQITSEDLVRRNESPWVPAYQVKGLFEAAAKPKPERKPEPEPKEPESGRQFRRVDRSDYDAVGDLASSASTVKTSGDRSPAADAEELPQDDWYCIASGEKQGPLSFDQLQALASGRRLRARDRVWRGSAPKWHKASEVNGLELPRTI